MANVAVPVYANACIAPEASGNSVYLVGIPSTEDHRLEVHTVHLGDYSAPSATFLANSTNMLAWSLRAPRVCQPFPALATTAAANRPFTMHQFMPAQSYFVNIFPNGTIESPSYFPEVGFQSPKNFAVTGGLGPMKWVMAMANGTNSQTGSPWTGLLIDSSFSALSKRDFGVSLFPSTSPLLSLATYTIDANNPGKAYHVVFDTKGTGIIYSLTNTLQPDQSSRISTLASPTDVDMNGIVLTCNAFPQTVGEVGYIFDKASDGSTVLFSITPGSSNKLLHVPINGKVPPFSTAMTTTTMSNKIILYGSSGTAGVLTATFNAFDTSAKAWTGPGLVVSSYTPPLATNPSSNPSSSEADSQRPLGAIIGGVVGGLVVIALIAYFVVHRRRQHRPTSSPSSGAHKITTDSKDVPKSDNPTLGHSALQEHQQLQPPQYEQPYQYQQQPAKMFDYSQNQNQYQQQPANTYDHPQNQNQYQQQPAKTYDHPQNQNQYQQQPAKTYDHSQNQNQHQYQHKAYEGHQIPMQLQQPWSTTQENPVQQSMQQTSTPVIFQPHSHSPSSLHSGAYSSYVPPTQTMSQAYPTLVSQTQPLSQTKPYGYDTQPSEEVTAAITPRAFSPPLSDSGKATLPQIVQNPHTSPLVSASPPVLQPRPYTDVAGVKTGASTYQNNPQAITTSVGFDIPNYSSPGNPQSVLPNSHDYS
ncbi:hypothetical protein BGZ94_004299 [Podila epigama]|nr:hypothetical protein BGZ94_004299 [Podila epigama]